MRVGVRVRYSMPSTRTFDGASRSHLKIHFVTLIETRGGYEIRHHLVYLLTPLHRILPKDLDTRFATDRRITSERNFGRSSPGRVLESRGLFLFVPSVLLSYLIVLQYITFRFSRFYRRFYYSCSTESGDGFSINRI